MNDMGSFRDANHHYLKFQQNRFSCNVLDVTKQNWFLHEHFLKKVLYLNEYTRYEVIEGT